MTFVSSRYCKPWSKGKRWASQRNFAVKHLRNFGFGKKDLEVVIEREASNLVEYILANNNKEMKMEMFTFAVPVLNVLWDMVAGHAFKREDKELKRILDLMNFTFVSKLFATAMVMPWVRFIFPSLTGYNKVGEKMITSYSSSSETGGPQVDARRDKARDERAFEGHWLRQSQVRKFRSRSIFSVMMLTTLILCKGPDRLLPDRDEDEWRPRVPRGAVDHDRDGLDVRWLWRKKSSDPEPT